MIDIFSGLSNLKNIDFPIVLFYVLMKFCLCHEKGNLLRVPISHEKHENTQ